MKLQVQTWSKLKQPTKYFTTLVNRATFNSQRKLGSAKRLINKTAWVVYLTATIISTFINSSQDKVSSKIRNLASTSIDIVTWALVYDAYGNCWYWSLADLGLPPINVFLKVGANRRQLTSSNPSSIQRVSVCDRVLCSVLIHAPFRSNGIQPKWFCFSLKTHNA